MSSGESEQLQRRRKLVCWRRVHHKKVGGKRIVTVIVKEGDPLFHFVSSIILANVSTDSESNIDREAV